MGKLQKAVKIQNKDFRKDSNKADDLFKTNQSRRALGLHKSKLFSS